MTAPADRGGELRVTFVGGRTVGKTRRLALARERHELTLSTLDERWWQFVRRWRRRSRIAAIDVELGADRRFPW